MTETLGDLLRRSADAAPEPRLDVDELVARAGSRVRRRRFAVATATAGLVAAVVVGVFAVRDGQPREPEPAPTPSPAPSPSTALDPDGTRPLVYAEGSTVHVGDKTVRAQDPVAFIDATDDGVVYEAAYSCTLWFTDGTTTSVIGTSEWTAAPTAHVGGVVTGDSGSLVVWRDVTSCKDQRSRGFVVYDTSRREIVGHVPSIGGGGLVLYVDDDQVYFNPDPGKPGCWAIDLQDLHPCKDPHLFRFDVASGETTEMTLAEMDAELGTHARIFVTKMPDLVGTFHDLYRGASFTQVGRRLVHGHPSVLTRTTGEEVRLRLPSGYTAPGPRDEQGGVVVSQWLDDDHVVLWASDGGGDLPAKEGDLLVCRLPDGVCRVAVPGSTDPYVVPWRG